MATYAVITGTIVSNIIVADNKEQTEKELNCILVEYTEEKPAGIGWTYNFDTDEFQAPE